jgi:chemotaxis protein CheD
MNHFLYPVTRDRHKATAQYGNVATKALIRLFLEEGSQKETLEAQIFGGAQPEESTHEALEVSQQNIEIARHILSKNGILIVSEDVGGTKGRKVIYNTFANEVISVRVNRLRGSDWHPYEGRDSS